jgi:alpha-beta hydrolase superfamily lysophospholipase
MSYKQTTLSSTPKCSLYIHEWHADSAKRVIVLAHGMMEHAKRYESFASILASEHISLIAPDHRGHGLTSNFSGLGDFGPGATWLTVVDDFMSVIRHAKKMYPDIPLTVMGHSMGSFIAQYVCARHDIDCDSLVISGTGYEPAYLTWIGLKVSSFLSTIYGSQTKSKLLNDLVFGTYNKHLSSVKTPFDWLCSDPTVVSAYLSDPLSGNVCSISLFYWLFFGIHTLYTEAFLKRIPYQLPIYFMSGKNDPMSKNGKAIESLSKRYRHLGHPTRVQLYPNFRHEILNEKNNAHVYDDLLGYFDAL